MKRIFIITAAVFLGSVLFPSFQVAQAASRISNLKSTQDPVAANPSNIAHTVTFTYTAQAGDPELQNFKVQCDASNSGFTEWGKTVREFKCTYPKEPTKLYTVRVTPQDNSDKPIGDPADLNIQIGTPPTTTPPPSTTPKPPGPTPNPDVPYNDVATGLDIKNPSNQTDFVSLINKLINWLLLIIAMVAGVMIIYSGLMLITNAGNQSRVTQAKSILLWSIIGLVVAILSFSLVSIIQGLL